MFCVEVELVSEFIYLGYRASAGGGCEAAVTARRCDWVMLRECGELVYCWWFPLRLKGAVPLHLLCVALISVA